MCLNGKHTIKTCANELHFDEVLLGCNYMEKARCRRDWCPSEDANDGSFVTIPSANNCSEYVWLRIDR